MRTLSLRPVIIIALACALLLPLVASAFVIKPIKGINKEIGKVPGVSTSTPLRQNIAWQFNQLLGGVCGGTGSAGGFPLILPGFCPEPPPPPPPPPGVALISEVAWMGSIVDEEADANAEWMEIWNAGGTAIDLSGWTLNSTDGTPSITITSECLNTMIPAGGFFLLVRDGASIMGAPADCTYDGALENGGEDLELRNAAGELKDNLPAGGGWPGGDNDTKETLQRTSSETWATGAPTPGAANVAP